MTIALHIASCAALLLCCFALCCLAAGCASEPSRGYSFGSSHPAGIRSIAVAIFENQTFTTGVEADLADALSKELQRATPYAVVTSGRAETVLTGTITEARLHQLTPSRRTGLSEEVAVDLIVSFEWVDARTGRPLVRRTGFRAVETFVPAPPSGERLELGRHAAVQEMARAIVAELRSTW